MLTFDRYTVDSTGAFLLGELERLDPTLHEPLAAVTWSRDIDLREDVSIADELSSFTNSSFAAVGGTKPNGKAWAGKDANTISSIALDIGKTGNPLYLWAMLISYSIPELLSAQKIGRPIDAQKLAGMQLKHNMDVDEMVYIGDAELGKFGLLNSNLVASGNVINGALGSPLWTQKTPDEILADFNDAIGAAWLASGYAVCPDSALLPPAKFAHLVTQKVSAAGNVSILKYLEDNCISLRVNGKPLNIQPCKWCNGAARSVATDRGLVYTKAPDRVRYPLVPLQRTPLEYRSIFHETTYFGRLGCVEWVYPETGYYFDGF